MKMIMAVVSVDQEWSYLLHRHGNPCVFWNEKEAVEHIQKVDEQSPRICYRLVELSGREIKLPKSE